MNLANKITLFRIILAPAFFVVYQLPGWIPSWFSNGAIWTVPVLWLIFIISEITDLLDGIVARKFNLTSDLGKLLDPFADTIMQITCFICFVMDGYLPAILFLLVIYREFGVLLLRNLMMKKGIAMGASMTGKVKTVLYIVAAGFVLAAESILRIRAAHNIFAIIYRYFVIGANILFGIAIIFSIVSFIEYCLVVKKSGKND
ncbi:MAG: CDP-diacylglycerol--glycerol-3-phosphate 3-phosphatidyltransferase [Treponema sp.]|jgi:CDP-diacylglycerol--glycerol-3-phosphate 3-phosphatidyltransferase|nr:CDP-diacylglycerol--glycerol-3-phosphate 3-phosphatidyltransferase [Treponema sp.]